MKKKAKGEVMDLNHGMLCRCRLKYTRVFRRQQGLGYSHHFGGSESRQEPGNNISDLVYKNTGNF